MGEKLRVAFNASALPRRPAGAGIYTLELGRALTARDDVELLAAAPEDAWPGARWASPAGVVARTFWEQVRLPAEMRDANADVYHGAHFATPWRCDVPRVATVHDLTFYRLARRYDWKRRWYYKGLARAAARAERVIVPSSAVAGDVVRYLGYPVERVRVIAEAPRAGWLAATPEQVADARNRLGIEGQYLLMVGTAEPGKRAIDGIRALHVLRARGVDVALVLAGNAGRLDGALRGEVARLGLAGRVHFAGYVADTELAALYAGAAALLFLSLYEGFGLPPLEAMACGTPVIASRRPAMDDVLGDGAWFVPAGDARAVADAAECLLRNRDARDDFRERGREHASTFSWDRAAAETVEVYREVARA